MSETAEQILEESSSQSMVTNPSTGSQKPLDTTRSIADIKKDKEQAKDRVHRYVIALHTDGHWPPINGKPLDALHYKVEHYIRELAVAELHGNA
jgi:hypothetical protein